MLKNETNKALYPNPILNYLNRKLQLQVPMLDFLLKHCNRFFTRASFDS